MCLDDLFSCGDIMMYIISSHGIMLDCNVSFCKLLNKTKEDIVGKMIDQLKVLMSFDQFAPYIYQIVKQQASHLTFEEPIHSRDGFERQNTIWARHTLQARGVLNQDHLGPHDTYFLGVVQPMIIPPLKKTPRLLDYNGFDPCVVPAPDMLQNYTLPLQAYFCLDNQNSI